MKKNDIRLGMILSVTTALCLPALAQEQVKTPDLMDLSIEDLVNMKVTAASRKSESVKDAPSNVTVITDKQIKEWGCRDLNDVLRRVAGFSVIIDRDESVLACRGNVSDNNQKYLVLIDGHPINSFENFGPGNIVERPNDLSNVKQIEVIRGPGSVAWGSGALAGVINIVTKSYADVGGASGTVGYGMNNSCDVNFQAGGKIGQDADLVVMGAYYSSDGQNIRQAASTGWPIASGPQPTPIPGYTQPIVYTTAFNQFEPSYMIQAKARVGDFKINAYHYSSSIYNRHIETTANRSDFLDNSRSFLEGSYTTQLPYEWDVTAKLSYQDDYAEYNPDRGEPNAGGNYQPAIIQWNDEKVNADLVVGKAFFNGMLDLDAGLDAMFTHFGPNVRVNNTNAGGVVYFDREYRENAFGGYASLTLKPFDNFRISGATWVDYNQDRGNDNLMFSPRVAVIWNPTPIWTLKGIYNQAFLRPANFQMGNASSAFRPDSEFMKQGELVSIVQVKNLTFTVTAFWQRLEQFINIGSGFNFSNLGDYDSKGVELEVNGQVTKDLDVWANLSYAYATGDNFQINVAQGRTPDQVRTDSNNLDPISGDPSGRLLNYPDWQGNLGLTVHLLNNKLFVSPSVHLTDSITYRIGVPTTYTPGTPYAPIYGKFDPQVNLDLTVGYEPTKNWGFYLSAHNLTDDKSHAPYSIYNGWVQNPGIYVEGKVHFSFN